VHEALERRLLVAPVVGEALDERVVDGPLVLRPVERPDRDPDGQAGASTGVASRSIRISQICRTDTKPCRCSRLAASWFVIAVVQRRTGRASGGAAVTTPRAIRSAMATIAVPRPRPRCARATSP
jgi:hypothetical protein